MLSSKALQEFSQQLQIDEFSILREYVQLAFLNQFYLGKGMEKTYFKGGTAIRLIYGSGRFSEDLDFTTNLPHDQIELGVAKTVDRLSAEFPNLTWKNLQSLAGMSLKIYLPVKQATQPMTIKLDFSLRESVLQPRTSTLSSDYPLTLLVLVPHLSAEELLAEKIRALLRRDKGRDAYDLLYLLNRKIQIQDDLIQQKFAFYDEVFDRQQVVDKVESLDVKMLHQDLDRFLPKRARQVVDEIPRLLKEKLSQTWSSPIILSPEEVENLTSGLDDIKSNIRVKIVNNMYI